MHKHLKYFQSQAIIKKNWNGYRVVAIDGSSLNLPNDPALTTYFGVNKNQNSQTSTGGKISVAYDVCNNLVLDALIDRAYSSEQSLEEEHLSKLNPQTDILVFDRGYPSIFFTIKLIEQGFKFCFRLSSSWKEAHELLKNKKDVNWILKKGRRYKIHNGKECYLTEDLIGLRLVKIKLSKGKYEVLLTNLSNRELFTIDMLKDLYKLRWTVEECYKRLKQVGEIEYFSGRTVRAIKQDFYSRIVMLNMTSMIESQCVEPVIKSRIEKSNRKHKVKVNRTQVWAKIKDFMYEILWKRKAAIAIEKMVEMMSQCFDIVRDGRSYTRNKSYRYKRKPLMYKGV